MNAKSVRLAARRCPCCNREVILFESRGVVTISCPNRCEVVSAKTRQNAVSIWNERRFTDK